MDLKTPTIPKVTPINVQAMVLSKGMGGAPTMAISRISPSVTGQVKSGNRFKKHEKGDSAEAWFMSMPMPTKEERWVWIDASADYPHLSKWAQVNFTQNSNPFWRGGDQFTPHSCSRTYGLGLHRDYAVGLDITGLVPLLSCLVEFHKMNVYRAKLVKIVWSSSIKTVPVQKSYSDSYDFSYTRIMSAHSGMTIEFGQASKGNWLGDFLKNAITFGIGFIPGVGPLLSVAFSLGWTAIANPDDFMRELSLWAPQIALIDQSLLIADLAKISKEIKLLVDVGKFNLSPKSGDLSADSEDKERSVPVVQATSYFEDALIALNETGTNPGKYEKGDPEDVGEVVASIPAGEDLEGGREHSSEELQA
ncbi:hypothetical protein CJF32_00000301 [Rutstroemia sp. NJR-2017a WRK4]|nr:hypothetical protein CJF32_00000301 [Rutstroemia sp. NJR-2017a WRK4]